MRLFLFFCHESAWDFCLHECMNAWIYKTIFHLREKIQLHGQKYWIPSFLIFRFSNFLICLFILMSTFRIKCSLCNHWIHLILNCVLENEGYWKDLMLMLKLGHYWILPLKHFNVCARIHEWMEIEEVWRKLGMHNLGYVIIHMPLWNMSQFWWSSG